MAKKSDPGLELAHANVLRQAILTNTKALEANTQALRGELRVAMEEIRRSLGALDSQKNLIPALCHSLDRLQAEFTALRLQAKGKRK